MVHRENTDFYKPSFYFSKSGDGRFLCHTRVLSCAPETERGGGAGHGQRCAGARVNPAGGHRGSRVPIFNRA